MSPPIPRSDLIRHGDAHGRLPEKARRTTPEAPSQVSPVRRGGAKAPAEEARRTFQAAFPFAAPPLFSQSSSFAAASICDQITRRDQSLAIFPRH